MNTAFTCRHCGEYRCLDCEFTCPISGQIGARGGRPPPGLLRSEPFSEVPDEVRRGVREKASLRGSLRYRPYVDELPDPQTESEYGEPHRDTVAYYRELRPPKEVEETIVSISTIPEGDETTEPGVGPDPPDHPDLLNTRIQWNPSMGTPEGLGVGANSRECVLSFLGWVASELGSGVVNG